MLARIVTNVMITVGGAIAGAGVATHPKANWGEFTIGILVAFFGMIFRGMAEG